MSRYSLVHLASLRGALFGVAVVAGGSYVLFKDERPTYQGPAERLTVGAFAGDIAALVWSAAD